MPEASENTLTLQLPRIGEPETSMLAGFAAPDQQLRYTGGFPNIPDSSVPGPLAALEEPGSWIYDFDPGTGMRRATFQGEVSFTSGGSGSAGVTSWNGRTGSVTLTAADVTGVGGVLAGGPTTLNQATLNQPVIEGVTNGAAAAAGQVGQVLTATGSNPEILNNNTLQTICSLALPAGSWLVWGDIVANLTSGFISSLVYTVNPMGKEFSVTGSSFNGFNGSTSPQLQDIGAAGETIFGGTTCVTLSGAAGPAVTCFLYALRIR